MSEDAPRQNKTLLAEIREFLFLEEKMAQELEEEGAVSPLTESALAMSLSAQAHKVDRCVRYFHYVDKEIEFLKEEIEHLQREIKKRESRREKMLNAVKLAMDIKDAERLEGNLGHSFSIRKFTSVAVTDEALVPSEWYDIEVNKKLKKAELKKHLAQGHEVPGISLKKEPHIIIK